MRTEVIGAATLICGCCEEAMAEMTENQFELAIVDTPYGIGESGGNESRNRVASKGYSKKEWDKKAPDCSYFDLLARKSKNQIIWGANHFIQNLPWANSSCWIVWDKDNGGCDFADSELAWTSFNSAV